MRSLRKETQPTFETTFIANINEKIEEVRCYVCVCLGDQSSKMRYAGNEARMGERRGIYRVLVGKSERKRTLGRSRSRWEHNIKMDPQ